MGPRLCELIAHSSIDFGHKEAGPENLFSGKESGGKIRILEATVVRHVHPVPRVRGRLSSVCAQQWPWSVL